MTEPFGTNVPAMEEVEICAHSSKHRTKALSLASKHACQHNPANSVTRFQPEQKELEGAVITSAKKGVTP